MREILDLTKCRLPEETVYAAPDGDYALCGAFVKEKLGLMPQRLRVSVSRSPFLGSKKAYLNCATADHDGEQRLLFNRMVKFLHDSGIEEDQRFYFRIDKRSGV